MTFSNLTELERRVADVLHHHAQIAMNGTDTETQCGAFTSGIASSARRRRVAWVTGAAAAAAIVIALVLGGVPGLSSNEAETQLPARDATPVQIATDFVGALAAYDVARATQDVAVGEDELRFWPGEPSMREGIAWAEAARFEILPKACIPDEGGTGSGTTVTCQFDWHFLGSDRLGWAPRASHLSVQVRGGRIEGASTSMDWGWAGLRRDAYGDLPMWRPFVSWLEREHPYDVPAMIAKGECCSAEHETPIYTDESLALWAKYVDDWVASQK